MITSLAAANDLAAPLGEAEPPDHTGMIVAGGAALAVIALAVLGSRDRARPRRQTPASPIFYPPVRR